MQLILLMVASAGAYFAALALAWWLFDRIEKRRSAKRMPLRTRIRRYVG